MGRDQPQVPGDDQQREQRQGQGMRMVRARASLRESPHRSTRQMAQRGAQAHHNRDEHADDEQSEQDSILRPSL